jgi:hypothetical protein
MNLLAIILHFIKDCVKVLCLLQLLLLIIYPDNNSTPVRMVVLRVSAIKSNLQQLNLVFSISRFLSLSPGSPLTQDPSYEVAITPLCVRATMFGIQQSTYSIVLELSAKAPLSPLHFQCF